MFVLDKLDNPGTTSQGQKWQFFTDGVMGGLSSGKATIEKVENIKCYRMKGNVTTENNGGFIQIRTLLKPLISSENYIGVYIKIYGNDKRYAVHIRTPYTLAPWQYYSSNFIAKNEWKEVTLPFSNFKKSNVLQPNQMFNHKIKSLGIVAAFDNFTADLCISEVGFY